MAGFREAFLARGEGHFGGGGLFGWGGHSGDAPTPFDALDGGRLAGPDGSHPLAAIDPSELNSRDVGRSRGRIVITEPVLVGGGIRGRIEIAATRDIQARAANLRLVGIRLTERRHSRQHRNSEGRVTRTEHWVAVDGTTISELPFTEPRLPTELAAGQRVEADFHIPGPRLGPPSAHLGSALFAWAVEARWDISMGGDQRVAALVEIDQNADFLRSGAMRLPNGAMFDVWQAGNGSIRVSPIPPVAAGSELAITVSWPGAGSGRGGRVELQADVAAPNGVDDIVLASVAVDPAALRSGLTVQLALPSDAPPSVLLDDVGVTYVIRAIVDIPFRPDEAIERPIAVLSGGRID